MNRKADRAIVGITVCLALLTATIMGCNEPVTTYQVSQQCLNGSEKVLVLPFMDTRTMVGRNDPHKDDLGEHARNIFAAALRDNQSALDAVILTPDMPRQDKSLTNGEIAELGRMYDADVVVVGQVFSFTETRAASIPPRAGMFVRLISAKDGSLLFVGDHYQAAAIPGASGGRDLQARNVSNRLVQGICSAIPASVAKARVNPVSSVGALASLAVTGGGIVQNNNEGNDAEPEIDGNNPSSASPPLSPELLEAAKTSTPDPDAWVGPVVPELPPAIDLSDDFYAMVNFDAIPLPPPSLDEIGMTEEEYAEAAASDTEADREIAAAEATAERESNVPAMAEVETPDMNEHETMSDASTGEESIDMAEVPEPAAEESVSELAAAADDAEVDDFYTRWIYSGYPYEDYQPVNVGAMAQKTGDEMAADLFASETAMLNNAFALRVSEHGEDQAEVMAAAQTVRSFSTPLEPEMTAVPVQSESAMAFEPEPYEYMLAMNDGPVISMPLAVEQPRTYRTVDLVLSEEMEKNAEGVVLPESSAVRVLVLPYNDRENQNNLIRNTGGGEVVTTLYGTQLSQNEGIQVLWDSSGQLTHDRLVSREEAIQMGKMVDADFVVRGQVVEFRRAQSVPSFYSAVISTAVLAAQVFFAEMSGVDVATEVYRVSDGECIMSRRDRAQQKYVVQAEKTVRRLATGMATSVASVVQQSNPETMDPMIDEIVPVSLLGNIHPEA